MIDSVHFTELAGRRVGPASEELKIQMNVIVRMEDDSAQIRLTVEALSVDTASSSEDLSDRQDSTYFEGAVTAMIMFKDGEPIDEASLVAEAWPLLVAMLNDQGNRVRATRLQLPLHVDPGQLTNESSDRGQ